ncbi:MAG: hypothetical protein Q9165_000790 [Trypethelium subeluteriae]
MTTSASALQRGTSSGQPYTCSPYSSPYSSPYAALPLPASYGPPYRSPYTPPTFLGGGPPPSSMTHSSKRSQPSSEVHRSTSAGRKRKLQSRHQSAGRQQSIPDIFTCQQKATSAKDDSSLSPANKRRKQDPSASTSPQPQTPPRTMATAEMYSFPQKRSPQSTTCIDLTNSPDPSPKARTSNGFHVGKGPSGPRVGAKKLIVKNLKAPSKANPTDYLEQVWLKLDKALDLVFKEGKVTFPLEELYRGVENVCRQGHASTIHTRLKARCTRHVTRMLKTPLVEKAGEQNVDVLRAVLGAWARWKTQMVGSSNSGLPFQELKG